MRFRLGLLSALLSVLLIGCKPRSAPPLAQSTPSEPKSKEPFQGSTTESANKSADDLSVATVDPQHAAVSEPKSEPAASESSPAETTTPATVATPSKSPLAEVTPPVPKPESVSTLRLVVLAPDGPRLIKFDIHIDGRNLTTGLESAANHLAQELGMDFKEPIPWGELLDKPLVGSGWLGNLVPTAEQRDQLIGLYDTDKDGRVAAPEFQAFLTRGLSRGAQVKLVTAPNVPPLTAFESSWGPLDEDQDQQLSMAEIESAPSTIFKYDFDADRIVTVGELRTSVETDQPMMNSRRAMYDFNPIANWDPSKLQSLVGSIMDYYTYSDTVSRELFAAWDDQRFVQLDKDKDGTLTRQELTEISDNVLDIASLISFPNAVSRDAKPDALPTLTPTIIESSAQAASTPTWTAHASGGRIAFSNCIVTVNLRDDYAQSSKQSFGDFLKQALNDAQFASGFTAAFDLKGGAFDLVRPAKPAEMQSAQETSTVTAGEAPADSTESKPAVDATAATSDSTSSEPAESRAWGWVVGPRQYQVQVAWAASQSPWFELLDANADGRLVNGELEQFRESAKRLDKDGDGLLSREEMPLSIVLTVGRSDSRGAASRLGGTVAEKRGTNASSAPTWFTGMDYNSDGELSQSEFLGDESDFVKLDRNRDGVIEAREINAP